jgi:hypothetical protein
VCRRVWAADAQRRRWQLELRPTGLLVALVLRCLHRLLLLAPCCCPTLLAAPWLWRVCFSRPLVLLLLLLALALPSLLACLW